MLANMSYSSDPLLNLSVHNQLQRAYENNSRVVKVNIVELINSSNKVQCHYEILLSDKKINPSTYDLKLKDASSFLDSTVIYNGKLKP